MSTIPARKTTSTLLDGNHAFPPLYVCYLLRSKPRPNTTYIGSTNHPPRRIRQHNGAIVSGARKTRMNRPWEMQMMIYGFPSKLAALQFEWAWQKPEVTRHLQLPTAEDEPLFRRTDSKRNFLEYKVLVARVLLSAPPFHHLPLHIRFYNEETKALFDEYRPLTKLPTGKRKASLKISLPPVPPAVTTLLDLGGVLGSTGLRTADTPGVKSINGPIDVEDKDFRSSDRVWGKWMRLADQTASCHCSLCHGPVDKTDHLGYVLCPAPGDCLSTNHVVCLAETRSDRNALLPKTVTCPGCSSEYPWGEAIRSLFTRSVGIETRKTARSKASRKPEDPDSDAEVSNQTVDEGTESETSTRPKTQKERVVPVKPRRKRPTSSQRETANQNAGSSSSEEEWVRFEREMMSIT